MSICNWVMIENINRYCYATVLTLNNPIPALGGKESTIRIDEIRNLVRYNFSSQNRCVTIKDYQSRNTLNVW